MTYGRCSRCKKTLPPKSRFCSNCGTPVGRLLYQKRRTKKVKPLKKILGSKTSVSSALAIVVVFGSVLLFVLYGFVQSISH